MLLKWFTQHASQFGKLSSGHRTEKGQFSFQSPKKDNAKECSNCCTIALFSHSSKVMLKSLQARFQQYMNCEPPDVQAGFRKGRGTRSNYQHLLDHQKSISSISALLTMPKPLTVWITTNCGKFFKRWE